MKILMNAIKILKKLTSEKKQVISNIFSLGLLQGVTYILPLITLPYLIRVIGVENFGLISFYAAIMMYFSVLTDYGFNLSATKDISIYRGNKEKLSEIFSSVMIIKFSLLVVSCFIIFLLLMIFPRLNDNKSLFLMSFLSVVGQFLFPVWFFQGIEKMKYITYMTVFSKLLFTVSIFFIVKEVDDYILVPLLTAFGNILSGGISLILVNKKFGVNFKFQKPKVISFHLKQGWYVFISRVFASLYSTTNVIILGVLTNDVVVGQYSIAEKIVTAVVNIYLPINQALYPYLAKLHKDNFNAFVRTVKKISIFFLGFSTLIYLSLVFLTKYIVELVSGSYDESVDLIVKILLFRIFTYPFGPFYTNVLIILQENKVFLNGMKLVIFLNFILALPALFHFGGVGLAVLTIVLYVSMIVYYFLNLLKIIKI